MVRLIDVLSGNLGARITLEGATRGGARFGPAGLLIWDDLGRLVSFDPKYGRLFRTTLVTP